jgi:pimeloyl-ACP methyl ester carboxylesterase
VRSGGRSKTLSASMLESSRGTVLAVWNSGPPSSARTMANIAREALDVLDIVAPEGPLVVVGHSQGGLYANAIARLAGSRVGGLVLLDPAHPDNARLRRELPPKLFQRSGSDLAVNFRRARLITRLRLAWAVKPLLMKNPPLSYCQQYPADAIESIWRHMARTRTYNTAFNTALAEYVQLEFHTSRDDLEQFGAFPDIPVVTLVHDPAVMIEQITTRGRLPRTDADRVEAVWGELLRDGTYLGQSAEVDMVSGAGHLIHLEKPDVVLAAITKLVDRVS